jgi:hypothetical protein
MHYSKNLSQVTKFYRWKNNSTLGKMAMQSSRLGNGSTELSGGCKPTTCKALEGSKFGFKLFFKSIKIHIHFDEYIEISMAYKHHGRKKVKITREN